MDRFDRNLSKLKRLRSQIETRHQYLVRAEHRCLDLAEVEEEPEAAEVYKNIAAIARDIIDSISSQLSWLNEEVEKLDWGLELEQGLKNAAGRKALRAFMIRDTDISAKNMVSSIDGYDEFVRTIKKLKGMEGYREPKS